MKTIILLIASLALTATALAQPARINYQGRLLNAAGQPLANATCTLEFNIYDSPDPGASVSVWGPFACEAFLASGRFNVILGPQDTTGRLLTDAFSGDSRFVEIRVDGGPPILPRQQVLSAPYALQSQKAQMADVAAELVKELADALAPAGSIIAFAGPAGNVPDGWLLCDGRPLPVAGFPRLHAAIGNSWGSSEGHFHLPDLRGMFLRGVNLDRDDDFADPDAVDRTASAAGGHTGNAVGTQQQDLVGPHFHMLEVVIYKHHRSFQGQDGSQLPVPLIEQGASSRIHTDKTQSISTSETRPKNAYVHYIIKY
jgi:hypothetical protein